MSMLLNDPPEFFNPRLAVEIGLNESIVLQKIHYWIVNNERNGINYHEGRYWTFNSIKKWRDDFFPWWSVDTVKRTFKSLENKELLIVGNFNKKGYDKTKWYTINYQKLYSNHCNNSLVQNAPMEWGKMHQSISAKCPNALMQNAPTNTIDYTNTTQVFTQQQELLLEHEKEVSLLKSFLGGSYTDEYAFRIINLLDELSKDSRYLEEKIEVAKSRKLNNKQGYLIEAVRQDYKNISGNKMNKFQNFNSTLDKYSSDELEEKIRQSQNKKFG